MQVDRYIPAGDLHVGYDVTKKHLRPVSCDANVSPVFRVHLANYLQVEVSPLSSVLPHARRLGVWRRGASGWPCTRASLPAAVRVFLLDPTNASAFLGRGVGAKLTAGPSYVRGRQYFKPRLGQSRVAIGVSVELLRAHGGRADDCASGRVESGSIASSPGRKRREREKPGKTTRDQPVKHGSDRWLRLVC